MRKPQPVPHNERRSPQLKGLADRKYRLQGCEQDTSTFILTVQEYRSGTLTGIPLDRWIARELLPYLQRLADTGSPWELEG
jgi:hypothetical protein